MRSPIASPCKIFANSGTDFALSFYRDICPAISQPAPRSVEYPSSEGNLPVKENMSLLTYERHRQLSHQ